MEAVEFHCGCGARLSAPAGVASVQCPRCQAANRPPEAPSTMATLVRPPSQRRRHQGQAFLLVGVLLVLAGLGLRLSASQGEGSETLRQIGVVIAVIGGLLAVVGLGYVLQRE